MQERPNLMRYHGGNDKCCGDVSTVLEDVFQYLDEGICQRNPGYINFNIEKRLGIAMAEFDAAGWARLDKKQNGPMWVPTRKLARKLRTKLVTTLNAPFLLKAKRCMDENDFEQQSTYQLEFKAVMFEVDIYISAFRSGFDSLERGMVRHFRADDGRLKWVMTQLGTNFIERFKQG